MSQAQIELALFDKLEAIKAPSYKKLKTFSLKKYASSKDWTKWRAARLVSSTNLKVSRKSKMRRLRI